MGKFVRKSFNGTTLQQMTTLTNYFRLLKQMTSVGCRTMALGLMHVYYHYFQKLFSLKQLCMSKSNFMWSLLEKEDGHEFIKMVSVT